MTHWPLSGGFAGSSKGMQRIVTLRSLLICSSTARAVPMGERKAAVDFRLGGILRREEIVELFLRVDHAGVRIAESKGAIEKSLLDRVEQPGCLPNELRTWQE